MPSMSHLQFKRHITKTAFETLLKKDLGGRLKGRPYDEVFAGKINHMTMYYRNNIHVGTWQKGVGWAFKTAYQNKH